LIEIQHHLLFVKQVVDRVLGGPDAADEPMPEPAYWRWYDEADASLVKQLPNEDLREAWKRTGQLHQQFLKAVEVSLAAAQTDDQDAAHAGLDEVFRISNELTGFLVGGSIAELLNAIQAHEQLLATRYERDFLEATHMGRFTVRLADTLVMEADDSFLEFCGHERESLLGQSILAVIPKTALARIASAAKDGERMQRISVKARHRDGRPLSLDVIAYLNVEGEATLLHGFAVNVTQTETDAQQRRLLATAVEASGQAVVITNAKQEIVYVNPAFTRITGYEAAEVVGMTPRFLQGAETEEATRTTLREALAAKKPVRLEIINYQKNGRPYWVDLSIVPVRDDEGEVTHFVAIEVDITERKQTEQEIVRIAMQDHLTGLANRRAAEDRLELEWSRARRDGAGFAVAIVDIDRFKLVNDQYGHHVGDEVLQHIAQLMSSSLRGGDWIARWGGEEFIVCFHDLDRRGALTAGERLRKRVKARPVTLAQGELPVTVSMGIALHGSEHESIDAMLAQADALLYEAKHSGRDKVLCTGNEGSRRSGVIWEGAQVQSALHEGRLLPAYQSIVDLRTGQIVGEEALARIRGKDDVLIPAVNFIQAAEALHLVGAIDETISAAALERCSQSVSKDATTVERAHFINLSPQFLANQEAVEAFLARANALSKSGLVKPVVIEITERQSADMALLRKHLKPLTDFGFRLALDDFGSGYSSFMYLAELPVNFIKVEGWMVNRIVRDKRIRQLVETLVNTAQKFKIMTVAECVEDSETAQVLCDLGVDWAQGYYFAKPSID
jgi:diguanylate cyclase